MINSWSLNPAGSLALVNNYADNYQKIASITYINATKVAKNPKVLILSIKLSSPMMRSSSAHLWSVRTQKYKKALALIETSVERKKRHIYHCGGTDEERKLLRDMSQPCENFCLPFSPGSLLTKLVTSALLKS